MDNKECLDFIVSAKDVSQKSKDKSFIFLDTLSESVIPPKIEVRENIVGEKHISFIFQNGGNKMEISFQEGGKNSFTFEYEDDEEMNEIISYFTGNNFRNENYFDEIKERWYGLFNALEQFRMSNRAFSGEV